MPSRAHHYAEAERLIDLVTENVKSSGAVVSERVAKGLPITLALAQVHATLASAEAAVASSADSARARNRSSS